MDNINLDFCILNNPLNKSSQPIIFVTKKECKNLDVSIILEDDYERLTQRIGDIGYVEIDFLAFQFSEDPDKKHVETSFLKKTIESWGLIYSKEFEESILKDFEYLAKKETLEKTSNLYAYNKNRVYRIPEIGEKISLYFYLLLECRFKDESCYLNLNGDFYSIKENDTRNFIDIVKCDFIRLNNPYNPNKIILKSMKTHEELIKESPIFKNGTFTRKENGGEGKIFVYYVLEVKNSLPKKNRITIEVDNCNNFDNMVFVSKRIKKQKVIRDKRLHKNADIKNLLNDCKGVLVKKMLKYANNEEYEKANSTKMDIKNIEKKMYKLEKMPFYINGKTISEKLSIK